MSSASVKNEIALQQVFGSSALASRLRAFRIGVWTDDSSCTFSGRLLVEALGETLGRLWGDIEVTGPLADSFVGVANLAAATGNQPACAKTGWNPPYSVVITVGSSYCTGSAVILHVGASGWMAMFGKDAYVDENQNPVGPSAAAALVAAEVFKIAFAIELGDRAKRIPADYTWNAWRFGSEDISPQVMPLHFNDVHVIGVGAVTHGLLWCLERWNAPVSGQIRLIDQDTYDVSNAQRYVGMSVTEIGHPKVTGSRQRLTSKHTKLAVLDFPFDMNSYFAKHCVGCVIPLAVIGVDSEEHRRQLGLKLPRRVVNMWTSRDYCGAARFGIGDGWQCLYCAYPENSNLAMDETGQISSETHLNPARVRELLSSGAGLTQEDINVIATRFPQIDRTGLVGRSLRSVRGILCATGSLHIPGDTTDSQVPFVFESFLAGIGGFVELVQELLSIESEPGQWQLNVLKPPVPGNWSPSRPKANCYLCSDPHVLGVVRNKYPIKR